MMKKKIILLVTNNVRQDQRMQKISRVLSNDMHFNVELLGRKIHPSDTVTLPHCQVHLLRLPFQSGMLFYLFYTIYAFIHLWKRGPDVIYCVDCDSLLAGCTYRILFRKKLIYDAHELFDRVPELQNSPIKRWIWRRIERWGTRFSKLNITVAQEIAQILSHRNESKFHIIRNLSRKGRFTPTKHHNFERKILLYQGMLNEGRGLEFLIDTMKQLPEWKLWIVGSGDLEKSLKDRAAASCASSNIRFWGFIDPEQLPQITSQATWGLNLLDGSSQSYYLSLANRTFDYMASGIPAIHTDFPEYRHIDEKYHCFKLLKSFDSNALIQILNNTNEQEYLALVSKNHQAIQFLNWEEESGKLKALIEERL